MNTFNGSHNNIPLDNQIDYITKYQNTKRHPSIYFVPGKPCNKKMPKKNCYVKTKACVGNKRKPVRKPAPKPAKRQPSALMKKLTAIERLIRDQNEHLFESDSCSSESETETETDSD